MKLHWSPRSPFVRKVMIVAHELGVSEQFECVRSVAIRIKPNPDILADSPVGRIPVMVLDNGVVLSGSYHICEYLHTLCEGRSVIIPALGPKRWKELQLHGVADGLLDNLINWRGEFMKPEALRWQAFADTCAVKTNACMDWLEARCSSFSGDDFGIGQITTGIALDYLDFRFGSLDWRERRPDLTQWHAEFQRRDSSKATEVVNDE